ncbi:unnamed protein product [Amoebophrya sp. A120]|nr:unnamed protein product [Amoebophrya sp. A120]|eukprot:GSA120T00007391001.1
MKAPGVVLAQPSGQGGGSGGAMAPTPMKPSFAQSLSKDQRQRLERAYLVVFLLFFPILFFIIVLVTSESTTLATWIFVILTCWLLFLSVYLVYKKHRVQEKFEAEKNAFLRKLKLKDDFYEERVKDLETQLEEIAEGNEEHREQMQDDSEVDSALEDDNFRRGRTMKNKKAKNLRKNQQNFVPDEDQSSDVSSETSGRAFERGLRGRNPFQNDHAGGPGSQAAQQQQEKLEQENTELRKQLETLELIKETLETELVELNNELEEKDAQLAAGGSSSAGVLSPEQNDERGGGYDHDLSARRVTSGAGSTTSPAMQLTDEGGNKGKGAAEQNAEVELQLLREELQATTQERETAVAELEMELQNKSMKYENMLSEKENILQDLRLRVQELEEENEEATRFKTAVLQFEEENERLKSKVKELELQAQFTSRNNMTMNKSSPATRAAAAQERNPNDSHSFEEDDDFHEGPSVAFGTSVLAPVEKSPRLEDLHRIQELELLLEETKAELANSIKNVGGGIKNSTSPGGEPGAGDHHLVLDHPPTSPARSTTSTKSLQHLDSVMKRQYQRKITELLNEVEASEKRHEEFRRECEMRTAELEQDFMRKLTELEMRGRGIQQSSSTHQQLEEPHLGSSGQPPRFTKRSTTAIFAVLDSGEKESSNSEEGEGAAPEGEGRGDEMNNLLSESNSSSLGFSISGGALAEGRVAGVAPGGRADSDQNTQLQELQPGSANPNPPSSPASPTNFEQLRFEEALSQQQRRIFQLTNDLSILKTRLQQKEDLLLENEQEFFKELQEMENVKQEEIFKTERTFETKIALLTDSVRNKSDEVKEVESRLFKQSEEIVKLKLQIEEMKETYNTSSFLDVGAVSAAAGGVMNTSVLVAGAAGGAAPVNRVQPPQTSPHGSSAIFSNRSKSNFLTVDVSQQSDAVVPPHSPKYEADRLAFQRMCESIGMPVSPSRPSSPSGSPKHAGRGVRSTGRGSNSLIPPNTSSSEEEAGLLLEESLFGDSAGNATAVGTTETYGGRGQDLLQVESALLWYYYKRNSLTEGSLVKGPFFRREMKNLQKSLDDFYHPDTLVKINTVISSSSSSSSTTQKGGVGSPRATAGIRSSSAVSQHLFTEQSSFLSITRVFPDTESYAAAFKDDNNDRLSFDVAFAEEEKLHQKRDQELQLQNLLPSVSSSTTPGVLFPEQSKDRAGFDTTQSQINAAELHSGAATSQDESSSESRDNSGSLHALGATKNSSSAKHTVQIKSHELLHRSQQIQNLETRVLLQNAALVKARGFLRRHDVKLREVVEQKNAVMASERKEFADQLAQSDREKQEAEAQVEEVKRREKEALLLLDAFAASKLDDPDHLEKSTTEEEGEEGSFSVLSSARSCTSEGDGTTLEKILFATKKQLEGLAVKFPARTGGPAATTTSVQHAHKATVDRFVAALEEKFAVVQDDDYPEQMQNMSGQEHEGAGSPLVEQEGVQQQQQQPSTFLPSENSTRGKPYSPSPDRGNFV